MTDTGTDQTTVTSNNGVDWYWSGSYSIGFVSEGDEVFKSSCDTTSGANPDLKLCWHTDGSTPGTFNWGYKCGSTDGLDTNQWTREIWRPRATPCEGLNEGDPCFVGQCALNPTCQAGECVGTPVTCQECHECDPEQGCVLLADGASCSDDDLCSTADTCQSGVCVGELVTCEVPNGCTNSTCNATTGQCEDECPPVAAPVTATPEKSKTSSAVKTVAMYFAAVSFAVALLQ